MVAGNNNGGSCGPKSGGGGLSLTDLLKYGDLIGGGGEDTGGSQPITGNRFVFCQDPASDTWVIPHNLDGIPAITIIRDSDNAQVTGCISYDDSNNVTITFNVPVAGCAYFN